jgi:hypothetical protein
MQSWLFGNILADWLGIFCMARVMYKKDAFFMSQCCSLLSMSSMKRKISFTIRKGEKQIQILDGYRMNAVVITVMLNECVFGSMNTCGSQEAVCHK